MTKTTEFNGQEVKLVCNALLPRHFRALTGKDLVVTLSNIRKRAKEDPEAMDFGPVEDLCWLMLKAGGEDVGESPEAWLETIDNMSAVYELSVVAMQLWDESQKTTSRPKKK